MSATDVFLVALWLLVAMAFAKVRYLDAKAAVTDLRMTTIERKQHEAEENYRRAVELNVQWALNRTPAEWKENV